ncbi:hypothetical protein, partial [Klebsiella pneumoniae]|uniref:hypothetical protein n=1 Tax=Klebsiella pneumoniae TaxID=573 RepID=UPI001D171D89
MATHIRNFGWNRVKLSTLTYDQLEQLKKKVEEEHACNNGIFLYDKAGLKKLDALSWAVYHNCKYGISYRELQEMLAERGVNVDHSTIYRWVQRYAPEMEKRLR